MYGVIHSAKLRLKKYFCFSSPSACHIKPGISTFLLAFQLETKKKHSKNQKYQENETKETWWPPQFWTQKELRNIFFFLCLIYFSRHLKNTPFCSGPFQQVDINTRPNCSMKMFSKILSFLFRLSWSIFNNGFFMYVYKKPTPSQTVFTRG